MVMISFHILMTIKSHGQISTPDWVISTCTILLPNNRPTSRRSKKLTSGNTAQILVIFDNAIVWSTYGSIYIRNY